MNFASDTKRCPNESCSFEVILGYSDAARIQQKAESFMLLCETQNIFLNAKIHPPSYDMAETISALLPRDDAAYLDKTVMARIISSLFPTLSPDTRTKLADAVVAAFLPLQKTANTTQLKNALLRTLCSLNTDFLEPLSHLGDNARMFYQGHLSRYDFVTLNILCLLGVSGMAVCLNDKETAFLTDPLFLITNGPCKMPLDFASALKQKNTAPLTLHKNQWLNFSRCLVLDDYLDLLLQNNGDRKLSSAAPSSSNRSAPQDTYKVVSLNFLGVSDQQTFERVVHRFYQSLQAKRPLCVIDTSFSAPTYEEVQAFNNKNLSAGTAEDLLNMYTPLRGTSIPYQIKKTIDHLMSENRFTNSSQKSNFERVLLLWLIRLCDTFYLDKTTLDPLPVLLIWGSMPNRTEIFLRCLEAMPLDMIQFSPQKETGFSPATQQTIDLKETLPGMPAFPYEIKKLAGQETIAYRAEQEIREVLSQGGTAYYQMKQFKEVHPLVLKTTFEEIDIIWPEPAKFRPGFSTAGDIATIPSLFAKIDGVQGDTETYLVGIQSKITSNTILMNKFPYVPPCTDPNALSFLKRVYFKDHIDIETIKKSPYYQYNLLSNDTQNAIMKGIQDFFRSGWYVRKRSSFDYSALEIMLRLPFHVKQLIHNFNFTEHIPKVIVFNATNTPCSAEDCVFIMFLKSLGFDVIVYAPTGYRIIEEHISESLFNAITIGPYIYDLYHVNIARPLPRKKKGLFRKR